MEKRFKKFFINTLIILTAIISCSQVFFLYFFETYDFPGRIITIVSIWAVTCALHYWLMKTVTNKPKAFGRVFMAQTMGKLLLYMTCILGYLMIYKQHAIPFVIQFFAVYIIFAVFEVVSILKFVKTNSGQTLGNAKYQIDSRDETS